MRTRLILLVASGILLTAAAAIGWADGGFVRTRQPWGKYDITVFTAPTPLRAGPVDVSVLVQDRATGAMVSDSRIDVHARAARHSESSFHQQATFATATNKLFKAALFQLPNGGTWEFQVEVSLDGATESVRFDAQLADQVPRWATFWPWFSWPALVVLLFAMGQLSQQSHW